MRSSNDTSKKVCEIVQQFYTLSNNIKTNINIINSSSDYLIDSWFYNNKLASQAVEQIIHDIGINPKAAYCFTQSMHKINSCIFDDLCYKVINNKSSHIMSRMIIYCCLIFRGYLPAINQLHDNINVLRRDIAKRHIDPFVLIENIRKTCVFYNDNIFNNIEFMTDISLLYLLLTTDYKHIIHINDREVIDTIIEGVQKGPVYLTNILQDNMASTYKKTTSVFMLGCQINPNNYEFFNQLYDKYVYNCKYTELCSELIGAIVYSCRFHDIEEFIICRLKQLRNDRKVHGSLFNLFNLNYRHELCIVKRLLEACANIQFMHDELIDELSYWLKFDDIKVQVYAALALEYQGINISYQEKTIKEALHRERFFRKDCVISCADLCHLRPCVVCNCPSLFQNVNQTPENKESEKGRELKPDDRSRL